MAAASWDPGKAPAVRMIDEQTFEVDSFRGEQASYRVTLEPAGCSCPHYAARLAGTGADCKHLVEVKRQKGFLIAAARARTLSDAALSRYLEKYGQNLVVGGALRLERRRRQEEETRVAALK
jgi:predicted nucleic acid-binding Zn finger protein